MNLVSLPVSGALFAVALAIAAQPVEAATLRIPHEVGFGGSESLDPISPSRFAETNVTVFSRLVRQGDQGRIVADLATDWSASPDATVWTFKLREGVKFHNGNDFTAEDVVFSLLRTQSEKIDSPVKGGLSLIEKVEAQDDMTAIVTLSSGHADFPLLLMDYRVRMLDADTCNNDLDALCESGIGTGPFKVVSVDPLGTTKLERYDGYWEGPAKVDAIEIIAIADQQARVAALQAGQIDVVSGMTGQQNSLFAGDDRYVVQSIPTGNWMGLIMRTDTPPFDDPTLRRALRTGVDREAMGKLVLGEGGYTVACDNPVWAGDQYRTELDCRPNPAEAKMLLAGKTTKFKLFVSDICEGAIKLAEVYQAQMRAMDVEIELAVAPSDGYWSDTWMKESFFMTCWSQRPADQILNEAYRGGASWNESYWNNPTFDMALDSARQDLTFEGRKKLYGNLQEILWETGGSLIPFHQNVIRVMSEKVSGLPEVDNYAVRYQNITKAE